MLLQPRSATNLAVETTHLSRLPAPYQSQCISDYPKHIKPLLGQSVGMLYSMQICTSLCLRSMYFQHCDCYTYESFEGDILTSFSEHAFCNPRNLEVKNCLDNLTTTTDFDTICKECKPECNFTKYTVSFKFSTIYVEIAS